MRTAEIEVGEEQAHLIIQRFFTARERQCLARQATILLAHGKVASFHVRGRNLQTIYLAKDHAPFDA
jgi:hypothetical protein